MNTTPLFFFLLCLLAVFSQVEPPTNVISFTLRCFTQTVPDGKLTQHIIFVNTTASTSVIIVDGFLIGTPTPPSSSFFPSVISLFCGNSAGASYSIGVGTNSQQMYYLYGSQTEPNGEYTMHNLTTIYNTTNAAVFVDGVPVSAQTDASGLNIVVIVASAFAHIGSFYICKGACVPPLPILRPTVVPSWRDYLWWK